jgi:hypothetical protein
MQTETNQEIKETIFIGWVNVWESTPGIVKDCTHKKEYFNTTSKGVTKTECKECNFHYLTDSSD